VGAQRAGTTWWYGLVVDHPRIEGVSAARRRLRPGERPRRGESVRAPREGSLRKELHFFDSFQEQELTAADRELYRRFFPRPSGSIAGEWTPRYMLDLWAPGLLRLAAPEAKILLLLRDPIERFLSGLAREARVADRHGAELSLAAWGEALHRSCYAPQLERVMRHFPRAQILVLQYERCRHDPHGELRRTFEFLGVEPAGHLPERLDAQASARAPKPPISVTTREELIAALRTDVDRLARLAPELDLDLWPDFSDLPSS